MVRTIADLLDELRVKELAALRQFSDVGHQGMIGDMYEGLTRHLLDKAIFDGLDLRVTTGKVRAPDGSLSRQIDAMVVVGDGQRLPYTDHDIYPVERVVAVVEVKKTLYGEALSDAYNNLLSLNTRAFAERVPIGRLKKVFRLITHRDIPSDGNPTSLPWHLEFYAHTLIREVSLPARIVLGYDGYVSEKTLRDGFLDYLSGIAAAGPRAGYGPAQFPSVILCGGNALVKLNAMTYHAQHDDPEWWLVYGSIAHRPGLVLLEVLWTRLVSEFGVTSDVFGDDLEVENINPLLLTQPRELAGERYGWVYVSHEMTKEELEASHSSEQWEPLRLRDVEAPLMLRLLEQPSIDTTSDPIGASFREAEGDALPGFLDRARKAGVAALAGSEFRLLTDFCQVVFNSEVGWVAGENSTGRLSRWLLRRSGLRTPAPDAA